jgi:hypothetical protein
VTSRSGVQLLAEQAGLGREGGPKAQPMDDIGIFLTALATIMRETIGNLEKTVSRVSEMIVVQPGKAQRDLVMTLQDFDRLQQEFTTLSDIIACLATPAEEVQPDEDPIHPGHKAVAAISIADLKHRLMAQIENALPVTDEPPEAEDVIY